MREVEKRNTAISIPGYQVEDTYSQEIEIPRPELSGVEFSISMAGLGASGLTIIALQNPWILLCTVFFLVVTFILPSNRISQDQKEQIAAVVERKPLMDNSSYWHEYESVLDMNRGKIIRQSVNKMELPKRWKRNHAIPVYGELSRNKHSATYVIKSGSRKVTVVEKKLVSEDKAWLAGFRQAMKLQ